MTAARSAATATALAGLAAALGGLLALAAARVGPVAFLVPLAVLGGALLVLKPRVTLLLAVVVVVLAEGDSESFLGFAAALYEVPVQLHELLVVVAAVGVVLEHLRTRTPLRTPGPFTLPLLVLAVAIAAGVVTGLANEANRVNLVNSARDLGVLLLLPLVAVNVFEDGEDLRRALVIVVGLVAIKAMLGAVGWLLGAGRPIEGTVLTYYEPLPNLLLLLFVLAVLAAVMDSARLPVLARLLAPLALAVLILSFRRNFWIALVVGVVLVLLVGVGAQGRVLLVPAGLVLVAALWVGFTALSSAQSSSPVIQRAQSLSPSRLQTLSDDRYRLDEQRNVRAELAEHPITGVGLGVPWAARFPLAEYFPGARDYTHVTAFWWWLKLGILGLVSYLWLVATAVRSGVTLWHRAGSGWARRAGLAAAAGMLGLAVAETTGSFLGVESRLTVFVGVAFGWLAAALALRDDARTAA